METIHQELQSLLNKYLNYKPIKDIADELSVSHPTIERWLAGRNLPHRAITESIVKFLKSKTK